MDYKAYDEERYCPSASGALELGARTARALAGMFDGRDVKQRILEIGCGSGSFLYYLKVQGFEDCQGVDMDAALVSHGRDKLKVNVSEARWGDFVSGERGYYDVIIALDVFEHIPAEEIQGILENTCRRLSKGGRLILRMPNPTCPLVLPTFCGDTTHKLLATEGLVTHLLKKAGFLGSIRFWETRPHHRAKRLLFACVHHCLVKPIVTLLHYHFYGERPKVITRNMYCCAVRS